MTDIANAPLPIPMKALPEWKRISMQPHFIQACEEYMKWYKSNKDLTKPPPHKIKKIMGMIHMVAEMKRMEDALETPTQDGNPQN